MSMESDPNAVSMPKMTVSRARYRRLGAMLVCSHMS